MRGGEDDEEVLGQPPRLVSADHALHSRLVGESDEGGYADCSDGIMADASYSAFSALNPSLAAPFSRETPTRANPARPASASRDGTWRSTTARTNSEGPRTKTVTALAVVLLMAMATPAGAEVAVVPRGAALSASASCSQGDVEIDYSATGAERQLTDFTADDGRELHHYDVRVYSADHETSSPS